MREKFKDPLIWLRGLFAAFIGGAASAGAAWLGMAAAKSAGVDVPSLNFKALGIILVSSGLASLFMYLKQSPLPDVVTVETSTIRSESVDGSVPVITSTQSVKTTETKTP